MRRIALANGDSMPALGLGTWRAEKGEVGAAVRQALELGYRHIDAAAIHGNEAEIGVALEQAMADGVVRREELWITSKLWNDCHAPEDVGPALERTLADLRLTSLDLYLIHWPVVQRRGVLWPQQAEDLLPLEQVPLARTWAAMEALQQRGLCRHIGVANFSLAKLEALLASARQAPRVNQVERHPWLQQPELLAFCQRQVIALTAYSPLGAGRVGQPSPLLADLVIVALAAEHDVSPARVALAWGLACGTSVIPKAIHPDHLADNLAAQDLTLSPEALVRLAELDRGQRFVEGRLWLLPGSPYSAKHLWDGPTAAGGATVGLAGLGGQESTGAEA